MNNQAPQQVMSASAASSYNQDVFDTMIYPAAGTNELLFFSQIIGQGQTAAHGAGTAPKSYFDTNLTQASTIPSGKELRVYGIGVKYEAGASPVVTTAFKSALPIQSINDTTSTATGANVPLPANEEALMYKNLHLEFFIGDKVICAGRLSRFPMPTDVVVDSSITAASSITGIRSTANAVTEGEVFTFGSGGLQILPAMTFGVRVKSPVQIPTLTTYNGRISVYLFTQTITAAQ